MHGDTSLQLSKKAMMLPLRYHLPVWLCISVLVYCASMLSAVLQDSGVSSLISARLSGLHHTICSASTLLS